MLQNDWTCGCYDGILHAAGDTTIDLRGLGCCCCCLLSFTHTAHTMHFKGVVYPFPATTRHKRFSKVYRRWNRSML